MRAGEWLKTATARLAERGIESARLDSLILLEEVLEHNRASIIAHPQVKLKKPQLDHLSALLDKRLQRLPMAYVLGRKEFYGYSFKVDDRVLIPRANSELLVEWVVENALDGADVLDMGTGSGAIAIAIKLNRPDLAIEAADVSPSALEVARKNAQIYGCQINFYLSDLFSSVQNKFDVVAANLPYIPIEYPTSEEVGYEPSMAVFSGVDGLKHYRQFFAQVSDYLKTGAAVIIEHNPEQLESLRQLIKHPLHHAHSLDDYVTVFK